MPIGTLVDEIEKNPDVQGAVKSLRELIQNRVISWAMEEMEPRDVEAEDGTISQQRNHPANLCAALASLVAELSMDIFGENMPQDPSSLPPIMGAFLSERLRREMVARNLLPKASSLIGPDGKPMVMM